MSDPRDVRLLRVPSLRAAHRAVTLVGCHADPGEAAQSLVLVPSRAAADELRRTLELQRVGRAWRPTDAACVAVGIDSADQRPGARVLPGMATRAEWYAAMQKAAAPDVRVLSPVERETLLGAAAREAIADGYRPPFRVAPGLIAQMLEFYDALRRNLKSIDDCDRLLTRALEPSVDLDRGAARMLQQARFLAESFRRFDARCEGLDALDEHRLRPLVRQASGSVGIRQLVVTLPDRAADPDGLWPADFDLIARLPGLVRVDLIFTEAQLGTGLLERLHDRLPGLVECRPDLGGDAAPGLLVPADGEAAHFTSRDREDELADALDRLMSRAGAGSIPEIDRSVARLDRCALIYQRPLPYLYLVRQLLDSAGLSYEAIDELPLAGEPYVAAFDLVIAFVASGYTRAATIALLGSPHLRFAMNGIEVTRRQVAALDAQLAQLGYLGGHQRLEAVAARLAETECGTAAAAAAAAAQQLDPLRTGGAPSALLSTLVDFLDQHHRAPSAIDPLAERQLRARGALVDTLRILREAEARFGDQPTDVNGLGTAIKRWIEGQTFAPRTGSGGLRLTDARAASYGDFDSVHLLGLVEGEWPPPPPRNIFFPAALLRELGWTAESDRSAHARAAFADLLHLAHRETSVSTFALEDDAIVRPAAFLEELADSELPHLPMEGALRPLRSAQRRAGRSGAWATLRSSRPGRDDPRFHGFTGPRPHARYSVTTVETYLACPFKYFAAREIGLEDPVGDDNGTMTPLEHGRIVHEVLERFFAWWGPATATGSSAERVQAARTRFQQIVDQCLAGLPEGEWQLERRRFMGTAATVGICDRVLVVEAQLGGEIVERLLEHDVAGEYAVDVGGAPTTRVVRGKADRLDLIAGGRLRVLDYKSGKAPPLDRALQLPVYAACAERQLVGRHGQAWTAAEAAYVPLSGPKMLVPVMTDLEERDAAVTRAERLLTAALERIEAGRFPPRPSERRLCASCAFAAVCRRDYVDVDPA